MNDTLMKRQEAVTRRQQAIAAEQERLAAEQQYRQQIADADAEIARLEQQAAAEQFEAAKQQNASFIALNHAAIEAMMPALEEIVQKIAAAMPLVNTVENTFQQQNRHASGAVGAVVQNTDFSAVRHEPNGNEWGRQIGMTQLQAFGHFANGLASWTALKAWVADAPDDNTHHLRVAVAWALYGTVAIEFFNVGKGYSAQNDIDNTLKLERSGRRF